jgi:hypothetical protein
LGLPTLLIVVIKENIMNPRFHINKGRLIISILFSAVICCHADDPPLTLRFFIRNAQSAEENVLQHINSSSNPNDADLIRSAIKQKYVYYGELLTNWSETLKQPPHTLPLNIRALHESLQFYFAGRTNYEEPSLLTLRCFRFPLHQDWDKAIVSESDWQHYELVGLRLRVIWFQLFLQLNPKDVLENHDPEMDAVSWARHYLDDFRQDHNLQELITASDFNAIMKMVNEMPNFTDDYVARMAKMHDQQIQKSKIFPTALDSLKCITSQYKSSIEWMYVSVLQKHPALFEARMLAIESWIANELEHVASLIVVILESSR